jgi:hypothetical protein
LAFEFIDSLHQLFDRRRLFGDYALQLLDLPVFGIHADRCRGQTPWRNTAYGVYGACERLQLTTLIDAGLQPFLSVDV